MLAACQHQASICWGCCYNELAGYGGADCLKCAPGSYSLGGFSQYCQSCGVGQTSPAGAPGPEFCVCPAGQGNVASSNTCSTCPPGSYSIGPASLAQAVEEAQQAVRTTPLAVTLPGCTICPFGWTSPAGAKSVDQCGKLLSSANRSIHPVKQCIAYSNYQPTLTNCTNPRATRCSSV